MTKNDRSLLLVCFLGDVLFVRGFEETGNPQHIPEFIKMLPDRAIVLLSMNTQVFRLSPFFSNISQLVTYMGGSLDSDSPYHWYCLIGFHGLETFPWIKEQKSTVVAEACEISSVISLPGNFLISDLMNIFNLKQI